MKSQQLIISLIFLLFSCTNSPENTTKKESTENKILYISVDESFKPVMIEQVKVFESAYPDTKVIAEYKSEADCIRDLEKDSTRIVIISRELSRDETKYFDQKIEYKPEFARLAQDAVAVIVNTASPDSTFTVSQLKGLLTGYANSKLKVAIDGNTATSTVRYLRDSLLKGSAFSKNVTGAKNSEELVNYISTTPGAVGFIGVSWITNPQTEEQEKLLKNVKMALIECKNCDKDTYAKPSQQTITFNQYPLVRGLYYVLKENYAGIGSRFINFLSTERGQLIFRRALLVPTKISFNRRRTNITETEK
jgi:phosphate transport system substrate-binding protein